jgi:ribonucleoside-diphosphate reductase alpha chain
LAGLGFAQAAIAVANSFCCGDMTLEGAPHLKPEHLAVFDCANPVRPHRQARSVGRQPTSG